MRDDDGGFGVERRTVLRSAAVATVGAGALSGTASATTPAQINFCGCSQVCVEDQGNTSNYQIVLAKEPYDREDFTLVKRRGSFCYELEEDSDYKVVGVRAAGGGGNPDICNPISDPDGSGSAGIYCNPGRCAERAIDALGDLPCSDDVDPGCRDPSEDGVEIVEGRCGEPGRVPPGRRGR